MRYVLLSLAILPVFCPTASAQTVDYEALRKSVRLPQPSVEVDISIGFHAGEFTFSHRQPRAAVAETKALRAAMKGDASDAERYWRLGKLNDSMADFIQAGKLFQERHHKNPDDGYLLSRQGLVFLLVSDKTNNIIEFVLLNAVGRAPKDWRTWTALGQFHNARFFESLPFKKDARAQLLLLMDAADLFTARPTEEQIQQALKILAEASSCYDKAVEAAPQEPQAYLERAMNTGPAHLLRHQLDVVQGRKKAADWKEVYFAAPGLAADLEKAADLRPDDGQARCLAAVMSLYGLVAHAKNAPRMSPEETAAFKKQIKATFDRAEKKLLEIARNKNAHLAGDAADALGVLYYSFSFLDQNTEAELWFRRAVAAKTASDAAFLYLIGKALERESFEDAATLCEQRLGEMDSADFRCRLALIHHLQQNPGQAEVHMRAGLKCDPDSIGCNLGLAMLLVRSGEPQTLPQARELLGKVQKLLGDRPARDLRNDFEATCAVLLALEGDLPRARELLQKVLAGDKNHVTAGTALKLLTLSGGAR